MADHNVGIPYFHDLVDLIPAIAVRLRRDVGALRRLIEAHAVLHQATRTRDARGRIVATITDYAIVRSLIGDLIAAGIEATVPSTIRETVDAIAELGGGRPVGMVEWASHPGVTAVRLARRLGIDKSAARRRALDAIGRGYLENLETGRGRPMRLVVADQLPGELEILPTPEALVAALGGTVAPVAGGSGTPLPPAAGRDLTAAPTLFGDGPEDMGL